MAFRGKNTAGTRCPYYISEGEKRLKCEGFLESTTIVIDFPSGLMKENYQESHCCENEECPIRTLAEKKYQGG